MQNSSASAARKARGNNKLKREETHGLFSRPQGAPRGLLLYYILHRISIRPTHGYEIAQDIEEKTEGAWHPAPGSVYPMLKKLVLKGLIRSTTSLARRNSETEQRAYEITPKGSHYLKQGQEIFASAGHRWSSMRRIFIELIDPVHAAEFLVNGSKVHFMTSQEIIDSKLGKLPSTEAEYVLKEYSLNLERQLDWTRAKLSQLDKKSISAAARP